MLITLLILILIVSSGSVYNNSTDKELGGGPVFDFTLSNKEDKELTFDTLEIEKFQKIPKIKGNAAPPPMILNSEIAIVVDPKTDKVLYSKQERKKVPIASITKVMTALVVVENIEDWSEPVRISKKAAFAGGAGVKLKWDEVVTVNSLFKAMVMNSDNCAAIALAEHVGGSVEGFAKMMNERAKELGALDTKFVEPSGLEDETAYSTAFDVTLIAKEALLNEKITKTMKTQGPIQINSYDGLLSHRVGNTNEYLRDERYIGLASRVIGGKTGFTYNAGYCLMMGLTDKTGEKQAIGVILNSGKNERWSEMEEVLGWTFESYNW